jgi:hypothetical protein
MPTWPEAVITKKLALIIVGDGTIWLDAVVGWGLIIWLDSFKSGRFWSDIISFLVF